MLRLMIMTAETRKVGFVVMAHIHTYVCILTHTHTHTRSGLGIKLLSRRLSGRLMIESGAATMMLSL